MGVSPPPRDSLGVLGSVEELLGLGDVLRRLVDHALNVGHVQETVLDLHDHHVQRRLIDWQCDGQDLQRHLFDALGVCSLLWTAGGRRVTERRERDVSERIQMKQKRVLKLWMEVLI